MNARILTGLGLCLLSFAAQAADKLVLKLQFPQKTEVQFSCSEFPAKDSENPYSVFVRKTLTKTTARVRRGENKNEFEVTPVATHEIGFTSEKNGFSVKSDFRTYLVHGASGYVGEMDYDGVKMPAICDFVFFSEEGAGIDLGRVKAFNEALVNLAQFDNEHAMPFIQSECTFNVGKPAPGDFFFEHYKTQVYKWQDKLELVFSYVTKENKLTQQGERVALKEVDSGFELKSSFGAVEISKPDGKDAQIKASLRLAGKPESEALEGKCEWHDAIAPQQVDASEAQCRGEGSLYRPGALVNVIRTKTGTLIAAKTGSSSFPQSVFLKRGTEAKDKLTYSGKNLEVEIALNKPVQGRDQTFQAKLTSLEWKTDENLNSTLASTVDKKITCFLPDFLPAGSRALDVFMTGRGPAVDGPSLRKLAALMKELKNSKLVGKVVDSGAAGIEGGHRYCVELDASQPESSLAAIMKQLRTIKPPPASTQYSLTPLKKCP